MTSLLAARSSQRWNEIAAELNARLSFACRTGKQCRERWINHLSPRLLKIPWTAEEETLLAEAISYHGSKWSEISREIESRSDNAIKTTTTQPSAKLFGC